MTAKTVVKPDAKPTNAPEVVKTDAAKPDAKVKVAVDDAKTKDYLAQWTLHHNKKAYKVGDTVALTDADAKALLPTGVIVPVDLVEAVVDAVADVK